MRLHGNAGGADCGDEPILARLGQVLLKREKAPAEKSGANGKNRNVMNYSKPEGAFTLIELLIVVAVIAILAAIAVPNFIEAQARAQVSREMNDMRTIATGLESYMVDHGEYPPHGEILNANTNPSDPIFPATQAGLATVEFVSPLLTTPIAYLSEYPQDPFLRRQPDEMMRAYGYIQSEQMRDIMISKNIPFLTEQAGKIIDTHGFWRLYAAGPDSVKGEGKQGIPYDPTNGTLSRGDIVRSHMRTLDLRAEDE
jgi:prepilin-type N-terminal cleavage/methylation domain-containing protein